jgi:hypothetical protein
MGRMPTLDIGILILCLVRSAIRSSPLTPADLLAERMKFIQVSLIHPLSFEKTGIRIMIYGKRHRTREEQCVILLSRAAPPFLHILPSRRHSANIHMRSHHQLAKHLRHTKTAALHSIDTTQNILQPVQKWTQRHGQDFGILFIAGILPFRKKVEMERGTRS